VAPLRHRRPLPRHDPHRGGAGRRVRGL